MKILIASWYFPPFNTMGALRAGTLAKYFLNQGHDVRVLCADRLPFATTLPADFPESRICRTGYCDINGLPRAVSGLRTRLAGMRSRSSAPSGGSPQASAAGPEAPPTGLRWLLRKMRDAYQLVLNFPDPQVGWMPFGILAGQRLIRDWRPDIIFATAPPFTTLFIGRWLARKHGIPWVAEFRDRWSEDEYFEYAGWRRNFERRTERWLLRRVSALVTVSEPWARDYRARARYPVLTVMNGFDPEEFPAEYDRGTTDPGQLRIVYTGILYADRRDPSPLFEALRLMGEKASRVRVAFYGAEPAMLSALARRHGIESLVEIHDSVPYREAIRLQMQADVLLLMQWNNPKEQGNVPGKLFEYIGARRPILGLGLEQGVPAKIMRHRGAGVLVNDPHEIARHIEQWIEEKQRRGHIPLVPIEARDGLSRPDQYRGLEALFLELLGTVSPGASEASAEGPTRVAERAEP